MRLHLHLVIILVTWIAADYILASSGNNNVALRKTSAANASADKSLSRLQTMAGASEERWFFDSDCSSHGGDKPCKKKKKNFIYRDWEKVILWIAFIIFTTCFTAILLL